MLLLGILLMGIHVASAAEMAKEALTPAALIAKLADSKSEKERYEIVSQIAGLGAPALPDLKEALKHRNWRVQWGVAVALGTMGDKGSAPALIDLLKTGTDPGIRGAALALGMLKEQSAVPHLIQAMQGLNAASAIEALGMIGDPGVAIVLARFMEDSKDNDVKRVAAEALGRLKDPMTIPALIEGLKSGSWQVQAPSRWALVQIGKPAVPDLIGLLSLELGDAPRLAAEALGELKEPTAVKPLLTVLKNTKNVPARIAAAEALGEIGDPSSIVPLMEAYEDMGEYTVEFVWKGVRVAAADSVAKMGKDSLPLLLEKLKTAKGNTLQFVCHSLEKINDPTTVKPLVDAMARLDEKEQFFPVKALNVLGNKEAVPVLLETVNSKDRDTRREAIMALANIADERALQVLDTISKSDPDKAIQKIAARGVNKIKFLNLK